MPEPSFQNVWIIWSLLLYLNLKSSMDRNSSSFIRFQFILHEPGRFFSESWNLCKLRRGHLIYGGNQFFRMSGLFDPLFCISFFKSFLDPNFSSFIRFQCILYDSGLLLSWFSNLYKLKRRDLISGGNQFFRMSGLFGPPFCI